VANWGNEIRKWLGQERLRSLLITSKTSEPKQAITDWIASRNHTDIAVISYELFRTHASLLNHRRVGLLICDEGHRLKSGESTASRPAQLTSRTRRPTDKTRAAPLRPFPGSHLQQDHRRAVCQQGQVPRHHHGHACPEQPRGVLRARLVRQPRLVSEPKYGVIEAPCSPFTRDFQRLRRPRRPSHTAVLGSLGALPTFRRTFVGPIHRAAERGASAEVSEVGDRTEQLHPPCLLIPHLTATRFPKDREIIRWLYLFVIGYGGLSASQCWLVSVRVRWARG
jgi:hypothetical protein